MTNPVKDPINDFEFPEEWLSKASLPRDVLEERVRKGTALVLSDGTVLTRGYTTGTTAAAAVKAAVLSFLGYSVSSVSVPTSAGITAEMPVESAESGLVSVRKVMNDHESDITRGKQFCALAFGLERYRKIPDALAEVLPDALSGKLSEIEMNAFPSSLMPLNSGSASSVSASSASSDSASPDSSFSDSASSGAGHMSPDLKSLLVSARCVADVTYENTSIRVYAGKGIGIIRKGGFEICIGEPAVNPKPRKQICDGIIEAFSEFCRNGGKVSGNVNVILFIPEGEELSRMTLNEKIGIVGGISVLGTTGFVEPWNDHLGEMKDEIIKSSKKIVLTTGRQGMAYATMLFPGHDVVLVGSRISEGISAAVSAEEIVVCGLPGLVLKWGNPDMMKDSGFATVVEMLDRDPGNARISKAFEMAVRKGKGSRIVVIDRTGKVLMDSADN